MQPAIRMSENETAFEVSSGAEEAFSEILTEGGARALFYHLRTEHGVSAADIVNRPADFREALASILGDYGSALLISRVSKATATSGP